MEPVLLMGSCFAGEFGSLDINLFLAEQLLGMPQGVCFVLSMLGLQLPVPSPVPQWWQLRSSYL